MFQTLKLVLNLWGPSLCAHVDQILQNTVEYFEVLPRVLVGLVQDDVSGDGEGDVRTGQMKMSWSHTHTHTDFK